MEGGLKPLEDAEIVLGVYTSLGRAGFLPLNNQLAMMSCVYYPKMFTLLVF